MTSSIDELRVAAQRIGLRPSDIQISQSGIVHYDVWGKPATQLRKNCRGRDIIRRGLRSRS